MTRKEIASALDIDRRTLLRWINQRPELFRLLEKYKKKNIPVSIGNRIIKEFM